MASLDIRQGIRLMTRTLLLASILVILSLIVVQVAHAPTSVRAKQVCDGSPPLEPTAMRTTSQSEDGRSLLFEWRDVSSNCMLVDMYKIYYWNYAYWDYKFGPVMLTPEEANCNGDTCSAIIEYPDGWYLRWQVYAVNPLGTTPSNVKTYSLEEK
jgi:hypothetical protein